MTFRHGRNVILQSLGARFLLVNPRTETGPVGEFTYRAGSLMLRG